MVLPLYLLFDSLSHDLLQVRVFNVRNPSSVQTFSRALGFRLFEMNSRLASFGQSLGSLVFQNPPTGFRSFSVGTCFPLF